MPTARYYLRDINAPEPNTEPLLCAQVVITCENKLLLFHRRDNFQWGIVSSGIRPSESFRHCAIRSTIEESNIHIKDSQLELLGIFDHPTRIVSFLDGEIRRVISVGYSVNLDEYPPVVTGEESLSAKWVDKEDLKDYRLNSIDEELINAFLDKTK